MRGWNQTSKTKIKAKLFYLLDLDWCPNVSTPPEKNLYPAEIVRLTVISGPFFSAAKLVQNNFNNGALSLPQSSRPFYLLRKWSEAPKQPILEQFQLMFVGKGNSKGMEGGECMRPYAYFMQSIPFPIPRKQWIKGGTEVPRALRKLIPLACALLSMKSRRYSYSLFSKMVHVYIYACGRC